MSETKPRKKVSVTVVDDAAKLGDTTKEELLRDHGVYSGVYDAVGILDAELAPEQLEVVFRAINDSHWLLLQELGKVLKHKKKLWGGK